MIGGGLGELVTAAKNAVVALGQIAKQLNSVSVGVGPPVTVAQLPAAGSSGGKGYIVSDATGATYGATVSGGGAEYVFVISDGAHWKVR